MYVSTKLKYQHIAIWNANYWFILVVAKKVIVFMNVLNLVPTSINRQADKKKTIQQTVLDKVYAAQELNTWTQLKLELYFGNHDFEFIHPKIMNVSMYECAMCVRACVVSARANRNFDGFYLSVLGPINLKCVLNTVDTLWYKFVHTWICK